MAVTRDVNQVAAEVEELWRKHETLGNRVADSEKMAIRYEGKLDQLLASFTTLMAKSNCIAHGRDLDDIKGRIRTIEASYVTKQDLDGLRKDMNCLRQDLKEGLDNQSKKLTDKLNAHTASFDKLKNTLWGVALILFAAIVAVGVDNFYKKPEHVRQEQTQQYGR